MEILLAVFDYFCRFSKGAFCSRSSISTLRNDCLNPGTLLNLVLHIWDINKAVFKIIALIFRE